MFSWLTRLASAFWKPVARRYARMSKEDDPYCADGDAYQGSGSGGDSDSNGDALLWCKDLERHSCGDFSFAIVQANGVIEDHSQVETGRDATFVGIYDGHGGPEASRFICDHLFLHLIRLARENGTIISQGILESAFSATENGFLALVRRQFGIKPSVAAVGSCCLVGLIWRGTLYVANLGDSRAVIGCLGSSNNIVSEQLTRDHNACMEEVRRELRSMHPDDSNILVLKQGVWRIKGIIQVSRSIGDAYLKRPGFSLDPSFPRFHLPDPIRRPVLTAEPSVYTRTLQPNDKFLIFASDGLWEHLTNQEATAFVFTHPRPGIARRLLRKALTVAARKRDMRYDDLTKVEKGMRRCFHDDITVVVLYIDHEMLGREISVPELSIRGFIDTVGPSNFSVLKDINPSATSGI